MKKIISFIFILLLSNASYADRYRASDDRLLKIQISELGPTRLTFVHHKIADVFYYPEDAAKVILHQSGSVFILPSKEKKHVYVTVISEDGYTQDLRLRFVFMQPKPIKLLKPFNKRRQQ